MSSRSYRFLGLSSLVLLVSLSSAGCQNGNTLTHAEEEKFKNPPKEMPAEAVRYMRDHNKAPANAQAPTLGGSQ